MSKVKTNLTRRHFLSNQAFGIGGLAFASLMQQDGLFAAPQKPPLQRRQFDLNPRAGHDAPKANAMISMFMQGGQSQLDLLDPKPLLNKLHLQKFPEKIK